MSQEFGQRSGTREGLRSIHGVKFERTPAESEVHAAASQLRRKVIWIGVIAAMIGAFVGTRNSGPGLLDRFWKSPAPPAAQAYVPVGVKDLLLEQVDRECRSRGEAAGRQSVGDALLRKSAAYVACLAADKPLRLCQLPHRAHLLAAMRNYYGLQAKNSERKIASDPQVAQAIKIVVTDGYVPRRDLVSAAERSDLEDVLRGVEARKAGCGRQGR